MTDKGETINAVPNNSSITFSHAWRAYCPGRPDLGDAYGATEQEAMARFRSKLNLDPSETASGFPAPSGPMTQADLLTENARLRAEVARLKEANRALREGGE